MKNKQTRGCETQTACRRCLCVWASPFVPVLVMKGWNVFQGKTKQKKNKKLQLDWDSVLFWTKLAMEITDKSLRPEQNAYLLQHMLLQTMGTFSDIMLYYNALCCFIEPHQGSECFYCFIRIKVIHSFLFWPFWKVDISHMSQYVGN